MKKYIIIFSIILLLAVLLYAQPGPISPFIIRFLDLIDAPTTFTGQATKYVRVNAGETALEFAAVAGGGDLLSDGSVPLTANWDVGNFDITLKSLTGDGTIEGATLTEGGTGVYNTTESDAAYQPLEATLTDIADGTINENLVNTANPWADNEIADAHSHAADAIDAITEVAAALKSGADTTFITGTAAANGQLSMFNADGDLVDASVTAAALAAIDTEAELEALLELQDLQGAVTDGQVPDNITIDLSTLASTVTTADDENTADNQEIVFTTTPIGAAALETDGDFHYNPSTGTITATAFVGSGAGLTMASTDLTDTADLLYEAELNTFAELFAQIADKSLVNKEDGAAWQGIHNFSAATSLELPNGTDPDVSAAGHLHSDTDSANETGDSSLRGYDGANQFLYSRKLKTLNFTLISPDTIDAADLIPVWHNTSGMTFTIVEWKAWSDDDDVSFEIEELTDQTNYTARTQVDACEIATDGTGVYYASDTTITHAAIEHDHSLAIDFDTADTPDYVQICIVGWFNSDID